MTHATKPAFLHVPKKCPNTSLDAVARHIDNELGAISRAFSYLSFLNLDVLHVAPNKPRDGMVAFADGTDWNPGSGEGIYAYFGSAWNPLHT